MVIWPFKPREPFSEVLEWKTDVFRAKGAEQRFGLRPYPRMYYSFEHVFNHEQYTAARSLILRDESFLVPDWLLRHDLGALSPSSAEFIDFDYSDFNCQINDQVIIWESLTNYESATIEDTDSNGITLSGITRNYSNAILMPLHTAEAPTGLTASRPAGPLIDASMEFEVNDAYDLALSNYPQYRNHDLVNDCPVVAGGTFSEPITWPVSDIDNMVGVPIYINERNYADVKTVMRWHAKTASELNSLRYFLHSRKGRWKSFWLSSFGRDFLLSTAISAADTSIQVFQPLNMSDLGLTTFDIEILRSGVSYYRRVTSYSDGGVVNGRPTLLLNIDSNLGVNLSGADRISMLKCLRFDADRLELEHRARGGSTVRVPCIEVLP